METVPVDSKINVTENKIEFELPVKLDDVEKAVVFAMLGRNQGVKLKTAKDLGIAIRTLQRKLKMWEIN